MNCPNVLPLVCVLLVSALQGGNAVGEDLMRMLDSSPDFSHLKAAIEKASVKDQILNSALPATVFAPNNAAFERIARELKTSVDSFVARPDIETIMKYHVVPSFTLRVEDMEDGATFTTMVDDNSEQVTIDKHSTPGRPIVVGANRAAYIIQPNIADQQAMSHVIDNVLLPKSAISQSS